MITETPVHIANEHIEDAVRIATRFLPAAAELPYHGGHAHTGFVGWAAERIGRHAGLGEHDIGALRVAAAFHDTGYAFRYEGNEPFGALLLRSYLQSSAMPYARSDAVRMEDAILATALGAQRTGELGKILHDADLAILGHDAFLDMSWRYRRELQLVGNGYHAQDRRAWIGFQLEFLRGHRWETDAAAALFERGKAQNIAILEELLKDARPGRA